MGQVLLQAMVVCLTVTVLKNTAPICVHRHKQVKRERGEREGESTATPCAWLKPHRRPGSLFRLPTTNTTTRFNLTTKLPHTLPILWLLVGTSLSLSHTHTSLSLSLSLSLTHTHTHTHTQLLYIVQSDKDIHRR